MSGLNISQRLHLLARGDNLDLVDIVCADAIADIERSNSRLERVRRALESCKGEHLVFEDWAVRHGYDMDEHPLHYLFMDIRTNAARQGWKAALDYVGKVVGTKSDGGVESGHAGDCQSQNNGRAGVAPGPSELLHLADNINLRGVRAVEENTQYLPLIVRLLRKEASAHLPHGGAE